MGPVLHFRHPDLEQPFTALHVYVEGEEHESVHSCVERRQILRGDRLSRFCVPESIPDDLLQEKDEGQPPVREKNPGWP